MTDLADTTFGTLTLEQLRKEIVELRERVEDLEDIRELEQAIKENADKSLISWEHARIDMDLD